jgi:hypothetical protein
MTNDNLKFPITYNFAIRFASKSAEAEAEAEATTSISATKRKTNIFTDEIINEAINPVYVFIQFLKNSLKCELISPIATAHNFNGGNVELSFVIKHLEANKSNSNSQSKQVIHHLSGKINDFFKQYCSSCKLRNFDDALYWSAGHIKLVFLLSRDFQWSKITDGLTQHDIAGFCTPEEEALLEPHLFDVELENE